MRICNRCVYDDEHIPNMRFDSEGICNYCHEFDEFDRQYKTGNEGLSYLTSLSKTMRQKRKKGGYDCIVGISGGCDSSYMLHVIKELGLKPLTFHCDNGWDTDIAKRNMDRMIHELNFDFMNITMDLNEYDDITKAFLKSGVPEIDAPADILLTSTSYKLSNAFKIKYSFMGHSFRTEGWGLRNSFYFDGMYIKDIHDTYGIIPMNEYNNLYMIKWIKWMTLNRMRRIRPLYYVDYIKSDIREFLKENYGFEWYGGHHLENKFTSFCDNYFMPKRFGIDLRYNELSAMVRTNQITRDDALKELSIPPPFDEKILEEIKNRLSINNEEFELFMTQEKKDHNDYKTYLKLFKMMKPLFWMYYRTGLVPKTFYIKYVKQT